uniref:Uncharacterized protein n=1 Tax=Acrobeloides nanus TaxID=290746 RepID=A0A914CMI0_9BILA
MNSTDQRINQRNQKATQKFCIKNCEDASQQYHVIVLLCKQLVSRRHLVVPHTQWHSSARRSKHSATGCAIIERRLYLCTTSGWLRISARQESDIDASADPTKTVIYAPSQYPTKTAIYAPSQYPTKTAIYAPSMQDQTRTAIYAPSQTKRELPSQYPTKTANIQLNPTTVVLQPLMDRNYYEAPYSANDEMSLSTRTAVMQASPTTAICQGSAQPKGVGSTESVYFGVSGVSNTKSSTPVHKASAVASNVLVYFTPGTQGKAADTASVYFMPK